MFVSFNLRSLDGLKQSKGGLARQFPARRVARGREKVGEMERRSSRTLWWSWLVGRGPEEAGPRRGAAGGGSGPARRCSSDDGVGDLGRGGSVEVCEGDGEACSGNAGRKQPVRGELELAGGNGG